MNITRKNITFNVTTGTPNEGFWMNEGWERETYDVLSHWLKKDKVYIDVGAWIGPTVLFAAQLSKKVYTFEPDPVAWRELHDNIRLNGYSNVVSINCALGFEDGILHMGSDNRLGESVTRVGHFNNDTAFDVACCSIDKFMGALGDEMNEVNFIKIDIEGGEIELVKSRVLQEAKIPMLLSVHPPMISDFANKVEGIISLAKKYNNCELVGSGNIHPDKLRSIRNYYTILLT